MTPVEKRRTDFKYTTLKKIPGIDGHHVIVFAIAVICCLAGVSASVLRAQTGSPNAGAIEVLEVRPNVYMLSGAGANVVVEIGDDGVVVVDAGVLNRAPAIVAAIKRLTTRPIRYVINTTGDEDHVGGNEIISAAGVSVFPASGNNAMAAAGGRASIVAEEHVQNRMLSDTRKPPYSLDAVPTITYSVDALETQKNLYLNGQAIQIIYQRAAHTNGDSAVFFRRDDVLVVGDLLNTDSFPVIDLANGGSINGLIASLNGLMNVAVEVTPLVWKEGGTLVIPGHGRLSAKTELVDYRDMLTIIRDRIQSLLAKGMSLRQIQEANPTKGYRSRFGLESGSWTTEMFVEAVYKSLGAH